MTLRTNAPAFESDIAEVIRVFYPDAVFDESGDIFTHVSSVSQRVSFRGQCVETPTPIPTGDVLLDKRLLKRAIKTACYDILKRETGISPPWGSLTGIRPTRIMYEFMADGLTQTQATRKLIDVFDVQPDKAALLSAIIDAQRAYINPPANAYDIYVGIPFCPSRCAYCSFAAQEIGSPVLTESYLTALEGEMRLLAPIIADMGLTPRTIYVGGGTPTALSMAQLRGVLANIRGCFGAAHELTVEAGRPDSVNIDMLNMLKDNGVTRISINPQTMSDQTLAMIGRKHTAQNAIDAYLMAQKIGFASINMDVIAALPGETVDMFDTTLRRVIELSPSDITVHTLAIKRASKLNQDAYKNTSAQVAEAMVNAARSALDSAGYAPYYLYRQKYMAGNLENVGYAKGDKCIYNIDIMEEIAPILAFGAGGITKWLFNQARRIERAPNVRNVEQYISRHAEMAQRKIALCAAHMG